jgi:hypothetical protein
MLGSKARQVTTSAYIGSNHSARYSDKNEEKKFLIYKKIQLEEVAKSYMRKGFLIYKEMRKYLVIYEEAASQIRLCSCSLPDFLIYEENFVFFFSVYHPNID